MPAPGTVPVLACGRSSVCAVPDAADFESSTDRLVRAALAAGLVPALVAATLVVVVGGLLAGLVAFLAAGGLWVAVVLLRIRSAVDRVLRATGARPVAEGSAPRWENLLEGLGLSSGVARPELFVVDCPGANAFAATDGRRSVVAATPALLSELRVIELEAVAANLLGRLRDGSARYGTVAVALVGPFLGRIGAAGRWLAVGLGEQRAVRSDLTAVGITRYPPGLAAALTHLDRLGTTVPGVEPATAHLWIAPVVTDAAGLDPAVAGTAAQPLDLRVAVLDEL